MPGTAVVVGVVILSTVLAGLSLLVTKAIAFDPQAWIVWTRELTGPGSLNTVGGPSWHPLPVLLMAPFTLIARGQTDLYLWLFIARAGALLAVAGVAAIAYRIAGPRAAVIAALLVIVSEWWFYNGILANGEPLMVALIAGAALAYESGAVRTSVVLTIAAALVRPEIWPFALIFGAWLTRGEPRRLAVLALSIVVVVLAWAVPQLLHSGASSLAAATDGANAGTARKTAIPFLTVFKDAFYVELTPLAGLLSLCALGVIALELARAWRDDRLRSASAHRGLEWTVGAFGIGWVTIVAVMAQLGFSGNERYLIPGLAALVICAAIAATRISKRSAVLGWGAVVVVVAAASLSAVGTLRKEHLGVVTHARVEAEIQRQLAAAHCPGLAWTFYTNRSTLAELTGQTVIESAHPRGYHTRAHQFVYCAPARRL